MLVLFSKKQLIELIKGKCIGESYPYNTHDGKEIEEYIKRLYYRVKRIPNLIVEADFNYFGSGYASFVEFFCYRKGDIVSEDDKYGFRHLEISGLIVNISRLAPVAIISEDERYKRIWIKENEEEGRVYSSLLDGPNNYVFVMNIK